MHACSLGGNRETPRPTTGALSIWSVSGRRGAVADDARTWGVRLRHSSWEADEQGGAIRCGAGGAKGGGRGECEPAKHGPGRAGEPDPIPGTSYRRPTHHPPDPEMAEGGHPG